jgi:hypothetical protein
MNKELNMFYVSEQGHYGCDVSGSQCVWVPTKSSSRTSLLNCALPGQDQYNPRFYEPSVSSRTCCDGSKAQLKDNKWICPYANCAPLGEDKYNPGFYEPGVSDRTCCDSSKAELKENKWICPNTNCAPPGEDKYNPRFYELSVSTRRCCVGDASLKNGRYMCPDKSQTTEDSVIVVRHGAKTDPCDESCMNRVKSKLNCRGANLNGITTSLNKYGIQQANGFAYSIPQVIKKLDLSPIGQVLVSGYKTNRQANTFLTISPYLCANPNVPVDIFHDKLPMFTKPPKGKSMLIASYATDLVGNKVNGKRPVYPFDKGSVLRQLVDLYGAPQMSQLERGVDIYVFRDSTKLTKLKQNVTDNPEQTTISY